METHGSDHTGSKQVGYVHGEPGKTLGSNARNRWTWTEAAVWTPRMLDALERGVKGGKWFALWDKVYALATLSSSWSQVRANKGSAGVDGVTVGRFTRDAQKNLEAISATLREGNFNPQKIRRVWIPKAGSKELRPLGIPTLRDRIVQGALLRVLEPIFEHGFAERSYGFRPGRSCKDALRRVDELLEAGRTWVVDADIKGYFDSIPHAKLMELVEKKVSDGPVLDLIRKYLKAEILDGLNGWTPEAGSPQGAIISPLLSNIYLDPLDHAMAAAGQEMVRYADDFVVLCGSEEEAREALEQVRGWMKGAGLTLHPEKTRIVNAAERGGFDFLGYHFERGMKWPRKKSEEKFKEAIRMKTSRTNGESMQRIIANLNRTLRGWFGYFKHSIVNVLERLEKWVRMRLRTILRKRHKGKGHGYGLSHRKWPNAYFHELGLFSMTTARKLAVQSARR